MGFLSSWLLAGLLGSAVVVGQDFEPQNFNVTDALEDLGINVTAIPDLAPLAERSSSSGCSIAVSMVARIVSYMTEGYTV